MPNARIVVYGAGLLQGVMLVLFGASRAIIESKRYFGLSDVDYAVILVPQALLAIVAALQSSRVALLLGSPVRAYRAGLYSSLAAMVLLLVTWLASVHEAAGLALLLVTAGLIGAGFGLSFPSLMRLASGFNPARPERSVLILNGMFAVGLAAGPGVVFLLRISGMWIAFAVLLAALIIAGIWAVRALPPSHAEPDAMRKLDSARRVTWHFKLLGLLAIAYGVAAVLIVAWDQWASGPGLIMPPRLVVVALHSSWAALVILSRILFAVLDLRSRRPAASLLPFAVAGAVILIGLMTHEYEVADFGMYVLAALGCAVLLPLTTALGDEDLAVMTTAFATGVASVSYATLGVAGPSLRALYAHGGSLAWLFAAAGAAGVVALVAAGPVLFRWSAPHSRQSALAATGAGATAGQLQELNGRRPNPPA